VAVNEHLVLQNDGLHYQGLDGNMNPFDGVLLDIADTSGRVGPGTYDLAGTNLDHCDVCVTAYRECDPQQGCHKVFYPRSGVVVIDTFGAVGEHFTATLHGVVFEQVTIDRDTHHSTPVPDGDTWCDAEQVIDQEVLPSPALVGETVTDFRVQNCATEHFVSLHNYGRNALGVWIIGSAGWCSACEQFIPQALRYLDQIEAQRGQFALRPMIIVGEDSNYKQPTLDFCRRYARHYGADPARFYIDHDGTSAFATTFQHIWPYLGANGEFGLPWNAIIRGRTFEYVYGDRSGQPEDLNAALQSILGQ
jgi:hypothetical protein